MVKRAFLSDRTKDRSRRYHRNFHRKCKRGWTHTKPDTRKGSRARHLDCCGRVPARCRCDFSSVSALVSNSRLQGIYARIGTKALQRFEDCGDNTQWVEHVDEVFEDLHALSGRDILFQASSYRIFNKPST